MNRWFAPQVVFWSAERAPKHHKKILFGFWEELPVSRYATFVAATKLSPVRKFDELKL